MDSTSDIGPLRFQVPEPSARPGDEPDFSYLAVPPAGTVRRPDVAVDPYEIRDLADSMIRVLDGDGRAVGPWTPDIDAEALRRGLRAMVMTRVYDDRMLQSQRQGKTSFYMRCTGEEAIAVAQALELDRRDMFFPTYRQQGWLIARDWPLVDMMCQIFSNEKDRLHGRQMPVMYSAKDARVLLHLRQPRHAIRAGCRVGDGGGDLRRHLHRLRCRRRGHHGRGRLPLRPHVRRHVPGARDLERGQQPVGDLVVPGHRRRGRQHLRRSCRRVRDPRAPSRRQ